MVQSVSGQNARLYLAERMLTTEEDQAPETTSQESNAQPAQPGSSTLNPPPIVNRDALALSQHGQSPKPQAQPNSNHSGDGGGFFGWVKSAAGAVTSTVSTAVHDAVNTAIEGQRTTDAAMDKFGGAIDSGVNWAEHTVDNGRAWLRQNGGIAGQVASDAIGFNEGATIGIYGMGKGLVQMANGAEQLVNPMEWIANPQANIDRIKSTVNTGIAIGKIGQLADPVSWVTNTQGNAKLASALWNSGVKSFQSDPSKFLGNATATVATFFIPGAGEAGAAADAVKVADTAADLSKVVDTAGDATAVVNATNDTTKVATVANDTTAVINGTSDSTKVIDAANDAGDLRTINRSQLGTGQVLDGMPLDNIPYRQLSSAAQRLVTQFSTDASKAVGVGSGIPISSVAEASQYLNAEIAVLQDSAGNLIARMGENASVRAGPGEQFLIHTHPSSFTQASHLALDIRNASNTIEAVIDWAGNITHFNRTGIIQNPAASPINALGYVVGWK